MAKEKTKLKNLEVTKVDFVDEGANQAADVLLTKRQAPVDEPEGFLKGLVAYIKKHLPVDSDGVAKSGAQSFDDKMSERNVDRIRDEMWNVCYALQSSFISILLDNDLDKDERKAAMEQSAQEFTVAVGGFIGRWSRGTTANVEKCLKGHLEPQAEALESMRSTLDQMIQKAKKPEEKEGGNKEMKIDKSKMTPADKAAFEALAKAYGWDDEVQVGGGEGTGETTPAAAGVEKAAAAAPAPAATPVAVAEDLEKSLHPAVKAELDALRKVRETYEERELRDVAKKYEVIGKKADDLVPVFKSLKASGEAAFESYLAVLDEMVTVQNTSGMFSEIGKSGGHVPVGATEEDEAFAKARTKAAEIRKSRPELTVEQAIDMAIMENPEIAEALM